MKRFFATYFTFFGAVGGGMSTLIYLLETLAIICGDFTPAIQCSFGSLILMESIGLLSGLCTLLATIGFFLAFKKPILGTTLQYRAGLAFLVAALLFTVVDIFYSPQYPVSSLVVDLMSAIPGLFFIVSSHLIRQWLVEKQIA
jgi:hypothetical protein